MINYFCFLKYDRPNKALKHESQKTRWLETIKQNPKSKRQAAVDTLRHFSLTFNVRSTWITHNFQAYVGVSFLSSNIWETDALTECEVWISFLYEANADLQKYVLTDLVARFKRWFKSQKRVIAY